MNPGKEHIQSGGLGGVPRLTSENINLNNNPEEKPLIIKGDELAKKQMEGEFAYVGAVGRMDLVEKEIRDAKEYAREHAFYHNEKR
ncbi:hypothetical protein ABK040_014941 [Willaertia magna]